MRSSRSAFGECGARSRPILPTCLLARLTISYDEDPRHYEGTYSIINYYVNPATGLPARSLRISTCGARGQETICPDIVHRISRARAVLFNNVGFLANRRFGLHFGSNEARLDDRHVDHQFSDLCVRL